MSLNVLLIANEAGHAGHIAATISKSKLIDLIKLKSKIEIIARIDRK